MKRYFLTTGAAFAALCIASPALAQQQQSPTIEDRVKVLEQKVGDTTVSGKMYWDVSNIENTRDGVAQQNTGSGFDAKRFYVAVDHRFSNIFSANVTTDFNYVSQDSETQVFIKKAYLQANIDPALTVRVGSADLPWVPFNEGLYGYRYLENVLEERASFGTSADWGVHALGSFLGGLVSYQTSLVNGAGYKKLTRSRGLDMEARVNLNYDGFTLALGGRTGHLGQDVQGTIPHHDATRLDVLASYTAMGARIGVQYMKTNNWSTVLNVASDSSDGYSAWASYAFLPEWAVFGRYDYVTPSRTLQPILRDKYFNAGVTNTPARNIDFSLAYKHEDVDNGFWSTTNGTIGGLVSGAGHHGTYNEVGIWGDFQW